MCSTDPLRQGSRANGEQDATSPNPNPRASQRPEPLRMGCPSPWRAQHNCTHIFPENRYVCYVCNVTHLSRPAPKKVGVGESARVRVRVRIQAQIFILVRAVVSTLTGESENASCYSAACVKPGLTGQSIRAQGSCSEIAMTPSAGWRSAHTHTHTPAG